MKKISKAATPQKNIELPETDSERLTPTLPILGEVVQAVESSSPRIGKDEMNLVDYPFALLKERGAADRKVIEIEYERPHPVTKRPMKVLWHVAGHPDLGLPRPTDEKLYLLLMELTRDQGFNQEVYFSRSELVERLGWGRSGKSYNSLRDAFTRLAAVFIRADNAFWNALTKNYSASVGFSLIDGFTLEAERSGPHGPRSAKKALSTYGQRALPLSSFRWNDHIFQSMKAGHLRSIDTTFCLSLESPLALRLYRYLDKSRRGRLRYEMELKTLCEMHLGMAPSPYPSKHKERLKSAHEELVSRGFLHDVRFERMVSREGEKAVYIFGDFEAQPVEEINLESQTSTSLGAVSTTEAASESFSSLQGASVLDLATESIKSVLSHEEIVTAFLFHDLETRDSLCDTVLASLPEEVQQTIRAQAVRELPEFLQQNQSQPGARTSINRKVRDRVFREYADAVREVAVELAEREAPHSSL